MRALVSLHTCQPRILSAALIFVCCSLLKSISCYCAFLWLLARSNTILDVPWPLPFLLWIVYNMGLSFVMFLSVCHSSLFMIWYVFFYIFGVTWRKKNIATLHLFTVIPFREFFSQMDIKPFRAQPKCSFSMKSSVTSSNLVLSDSLSCVFLHGH